MRALLGWKILPRTDPTVVWRWVGALLLHCDVLYSSGIRLLVRLLMLQHGTVSGWLSHRITCEYEICCDPGNDTDGLGWHALRISRSYWDQVWGWVRIIINATKSVVKFYRICLPASFRATKIWARSRGSRMCTVVGRYVSLLFNFTTSFVLRTQGIFMVLRLAGIRAVSWLMGSTKTGQQLSRHEVELLMF